ncbi:MAG: carboxypeptidase-like regulatory domain-containing protein [Bacteroidales bacterium]|nr:carboxypeptidase-like regulatory domain-containing protein [Bacteroidales bacterium]
MDKKLKYYLFGLLIILGITNTYAQDFPEKKITLNLKNVPVHQALREITKQSGYYFTYEGDVIDANKIINKDFKKTPLKKCLDDILNDSTLTYQVYDNHIIIKNKHLIYVDSLLNNPDIKIIQLQARIIDAVSGEALSYASISIQNSNIGTVSNNNGIFLLKIPKEYINRNLCISYIGYNNDCFPAITLYHNPQVIKLSRNYISLQEVLIRNRNPKSIIRRTIKKIPENYPEKPSYLLTFYREKVKQKNKYMFLSEAVLKIYKTDYSSPQNDLLQVLKSRTFHNVKQQDSVQMKLKSGLKTALVLDIVKNIPDFLNEEYFPQYKYYINDIESYDNKTSFVIAFEPRKYEKDAIYRGLIYIDAESLAIIGADYEISPDRIYNMNNRFVIKKEKGIKVRLKKANYQVNYQNRGKKYYLKYVKAELNFKVKMKKKWFSTNFTTSLEMAVSNIDTMNVQKFKRKETNKTNTVFVDEAHEYDEKFWEDYNFIKPEDDWQQAIKKLQLKLANSNQL